MLTGKAYECDRCGKEFTLEADEEVFKFGDGGFHEKEVPDSKKIEELCPTCCKGFCEWLFDPKVVKVEKSK